MRLSYPSQRAAGHSRRAVVLFSLLTIVLAACVPPRAAPAAGPQTNAGTSVPALPAGAGSVARIRARGLLRAGIRFDRAPFGYVTADGDLAGFDVDLVREMARRWLGDANKVDFFQITPRTAASKLGGDGVDLLLGALPRDRALESVADFAQPYYVGGPAFLLRKGDTLGAFADLANQTLAVGQGESAASLLASRASAEGISVTLRSFVTHTLALAALQQGSVYAVLGDSVTLAEDARVNAGLWLAPARFWPSYDAPAVAQGDSVFRSVVDFTLQAMKADGTYDKMYARWFPGDASPPLNAWPGKPPFDFATAPEEGDAPESAVDRLRAGKPLRVGVLPDRPGWSTLGTSGTAEGFVVDLMNECVRRWMGAKAAVQYVAVTGDGGPAVLHAGRIDVLAAPLTASAELLDRADVSVPYFQDGQILLLAPRARYASLDDLANLKVAAAGQAAADALQAALAPRGISVELQAYPDLSAAMAAWDADEANAVTADMSALSPLYVARGDFKLAGPLLTHGPEQVLGVPVQDGRLRDVLNFTLQAMDEDGTYAQIYARWYGQAPPYDLPVWPGSPADLGVNLHARP